jgi:hypothetical protein
VSACAFRIFSSSRALLIVEALQVCGPRIVHTFVLLVFLLVFGWAMLLLCFDTNMACQTPQQCLNEILVIGFSFAGTSDQLILSEYPVHILPDGDGGSPATRTLQLGSILFMFVVLNIVLLNLVVGQVVDAFAQLQHRRDKKLEDGNQFCLICSLPRPAFETSRGETGGFEWHTRTEHNPWHYVLFVVYAQNEPEFKLRHSLKRFLHKVSHVDNSYLPVLQAHSLRRATQQKDKYGEVSAKIDGLAKRLDGLALARPSVPHPQTQVPAGVVHVAGGCAVGSHGVCAGS